MIKRTKGFKSLTQFSKFVWPSTVWTSWAICHAHLMSTKQML